MARSEVVLALVAMMAIHGCLARTLQSYAGTPAELSADNSNLSSVLLLIDGLGVLPSGNIDAGITIFAPQNSGVQSLITSLGLTLPTDAAGMSSFLTKLGPLQNLLITAILYNISPSIVTPPTGTDSITVPTLLNGSTITLQSTSSGLQAVTPGNGKPVSISDVFNWNGAQIIVTAQVLLPAAPLTSIKATTVSAAQAIIAAMSVSLGGGSSAPAPAPAKAPAPAPAA